MLNKTFIQGRFVSDPELRHTQNNVAVATFRLAVERDFKDKDSGERKADFINVVAWRQTGEFVSRYFSKGRMAIVEGKLQTRDYTDRDGNRRYATEVIADHVYFGDSKREDDGGRASIDDYAAAGRAYYASNPGPDQFAELTDDDGELPF